MYDQDFKPVGDEIARTEGIDLANKSVDRVVVGPEAVNGSDTRLAVAVEHELVGHVQAVEGGYHPYALPGTDAAIRFEAALNISDAGFSARIGDVQYAQHLLDVSSAHIDYLEGR